MNISKDIGLNTDFYPHIMLQFGETLFSQDKVAMEYSKSFLNICYLKSATEFEICE